MQGLVPRAANSHRARIRSYRILTAALVTVGAVTLSGCTPDAPDSANSQAGPQAQAAPPSTEPAGQPALQAFYHQRLNWTPCGELQCATLTVPMDYSRPQDGRTFTLPVARHTVADPAQRIGSLVLNPASGHEIPGGVCVVLGHEPVPAVSCDPRGRGSQDTHVSTSWGSVPGAT
ncbi:hypothetical protein ACIRYZ_44705 [Kitasatospora sp. NPDC101155]|uniref:hypothetical protein n=1 Tax=Kitasatospora sp. NPDC101155 TaxID=3364097 RepID=UPI003804740B